jgi:signal transduction histidine kinase
VLVAATIAVVLVGVVDYATGPRVSMIVLYLVPVTWLAARAGRWPGSTLAAFSAAVAIVADILLQPASSDRFAAGVNVVVMLITLLVIVELVQRLRIRADAARQAEEHGREFLGYAAHQLRTPLARINACVDALMLDPSGVNEHEALLGSLSEETARAGRLLQSLLLIARLDQHEPLNLQTANLDTIVQREVDRAARSRSSIRWITELPSAASTSLECDADRVAEAIANLLDNAGRYARHEVTVTVRTRSESVDIDVRDDGPGIPPEQRDLAFARFGTVGPHGGTGLGLPIARSIADAHGGSLHYDGKSFILRLPMHRSRHRRHRDSRTNR